MTSGVIGFFANFLRTADFASSYSSSVMAPLSYNSLSSRISSAMLMGLAHYESGFYVSSYAVAPCASRPGTSTTLPAFNAWILCTPWRTSSRYLFRRAQVNDPILPQSVDVQEGVEVEHG